MFASASYFVYVSWAYVRAAQRVLRRLKSRSLCRVYVVAEAHDLQRFRRGVEGWRSCTALPPLQIRSSPPERLDDSAESGPLTASPTRQIAAGMQKRATPFEMTRDLQLRRTVERCRNPDGALKAPRRRLRQMQRRPGHADSATAPVRRAQQTRVVSTALERAVSAGRDLRKPCLRRR